MAENRRTSLRKVCEVCAQKDRKIEKLERTIKNQEAIIADLRKLLESSKELLSMAKEVMIELEKIDWTKGSALDLILARFSNKV